MSYCTPRLALLLAGLMVYTICAADAAPSSSRLDEDESRTFLRGWLLFDDPASEGARRKGPTPKSVFIAPVVKDLPACAQGYQADAMGRCHRVFQINQNAQLGFLLQKLNAMYANNPKLTKRPVGTTEGPVQVPIPLALQPPVKESPVSTTPAQVQVSATAVPGEQEVEMVVVAAEVQLKDDRQQSTSLPGAIVTLWQLNSSSTPAPETTTVQPDQETASTLSPGELTTQTDNGSTPTEQFTTFTDTGTTQTELETTQTELGTTQTELGTTQTDLGTTQTELGTTQVDFGTTQTDLGTTQTDMSTSIGTRETDASTTHNSDPTTQEETTFSESTTEMPAAEATTVTEGEDNPPTPSSSTLRPLRTSTVTSLSVHHSDSTDVRVVEAADLSGQNTAEEPTTFGLPSSPWEGQFRWPTEAQPEEPPPPESPSGPGWSWGPWHHTTTTPRPPLYLNFWSTPPQVPDPTIRTRTGVRRPVSQYPATFNGRPAPLFYQELTGQDVTTVFRNQQAWYRGRGQHQ